MPPLVGVAVKVTLEPAHDVCAPEVIAILTVAGASEFTVIVPVAFILPQPPVNGML